MIGVMKLPDYVEARRRLGDIGPSLQASAAKGVFDLANEVRVYLVWNVVSRGFRLARLKPATIRRKGHSVPLVNTMGYLDHIQVLTDPEGYRVGFAEGARAADGRSYADLAGDLEYGNSKMKPRPHWRPTAAWANKRMPGIGASILSGIRSR